MGPAQGPGLQRWEGETPAAVAMLGHLRPRGAPILHHDRIDGGVDLVYSGQVGIEQVQGRDFALAQSPYQCSGRAKRKLGNGHGWVLAVPAQFSVLLRLQIDRLGNRPVHSNFAQVMLVRLLGRPQVKPLRASRCNLAFDIR